MNCSPFDLKDFFFGELSETQRADVCAHLEACSQCREELGRLRMTDTALRAVAGEEPPRRIAFVSDRVFEPRWWQVVWNSGPRLGFVSATMLAAAILVHGVMMRPGSQQPVLARVDATVVEARVQAEVARRLDTAVQAAVAASEARQARKTGDMIEAVRRDLEYKRQADRVAFNEIATVMQKRYNSVLVASADLGGAR